MANNTPRGRKKNVTGESGSINKRGEGLGTGPVGNSGGYSGRPGAGGQYGPERASGGGLSSLLNGKSLIVIAVIVILFLIFRNKLPFFNNGGSSSESPISSSILSSFTSSSVSDGSWTRTANTGVLNTKVASGSRAKYTKIKGNGKDQITIMVYMCGTDLESKGGMASSDLSEMAKATLSDNVNILVYTGGCSKWQTSAISSKTNQIWKVEDGGIRCLEQDMGNVAMTAPSTLTQFINYCSDNYSANRMCLIFWDHGGGSLSGYGYDERFKNSGSMSLAGIDTALKNAGVKFDFIGFDACLMATAENALVLSQYADYLIASEETEPGVGWYYTNWLTKLSAKPGMATVELGKIIVDDFTEFCENHLDSAKTTLSVVDLAEFENTVPDSLKSFAVSTTELINTDSGSGKNYQTVSDARSSAREFSSSSKIDQVDLVDLATRIGTDDAKKLADAILGSVKYNKTSGAMTNSYGLSIYFPYRRVSSVDSAVKEYDKIGLDDEYSDCIKAFAGLGTAGVLSTTSQSSSGGTSALSSLLGNLSAVSTSGQTSSASLISSLLSGYLGGGSSSSSSSIISGLTSSGISSLLSGLDLGRASSFIQANHLDSTDFIFTDYNGKNVIGLPDEKWELVQDIELNVFIDDGNGYIDLGLDNFMDVSDGYLNEISRDEISWLAINGQVVAYYHESTVDDGRNYTITGTVPVLVNNERAEIILVFDNEHEDGVVTGVRYLYDDDTAPSSKPADLNEGDVIDFLCDYYTYRGEYQDSYKLGDQITYNGSLTVSDLKLSADNKVNATYRITDIYGQHFWTSVFWTTVSTN